MPTPTLPSRLLAIAVLLLPLTAPRAPAAPTPRDATPVLEFAIETATDAAAHAKAAAAFDAKLAAQAGHASTQRAAVVDRDGVSVRATVWNDVADAEAAALALDGSAETKALAAAIDASGSSTSHFRQVRSHRYRDEPGGHLEVVVFRTRPGTTREANLERFDKAEAEFAAGPGLHEHSLWLAPDGNWVHLLRWGTAADYTKTGKALFQKPGVGGWIRSLDFQRFVVSRGDVVDAGAEPAKKGR